MVKLSLLTREIHCTNIPTTAHESYQLYILKRKDENTEKEAGKGPSFKNELLLHSGNISRERERSWGSRTHRLKRFEPVGGSEATSPFSPRPSPLYSRQKFPHQRRKKSRQLSARKEGCCSFSLSLSLSFSLSHSLSHTHSPSRSQAAILAAITIHFLSS